MEDPYANVIVGKLNLKGGALKKKYVVYEILHNQQVKEKS